MWRKALTVASCAFLSATYVPAFAQTDIQDSLRPPIPVGPSGPADAPAKNPPSTPGVSQFDDLSTSTDNQKALEELEAVEAESKAAAGAIFVTPEKVYVKAPVLQALITLDRDMSPYELDAQRSRPIDLSDVVETAVRNNLAIKVSQTQVGQKKWLWISSIGNFLPTIASEFSFQGLSGDYASPAGLVIPIHNRYLNLNAGYSQYLFKGGGILYSARQAKHEYKAAQYGLQDTINDVLLQSVKSYYDLALNDVLLQIRIKAVELGKGLVIVNEDMFHEGVNTQLDLLQAKYELSSDRQHLISQQIDRRESAVKLATLLNLDAGEDLTLKRRLLGKVTLVDKRLKPGDLLKLAVEHRPELKRHEQLRLAALDQVKVARSQLLPAVTTSGSVVGTGSKAASLSQEAGTPLATTGGGTAGIGAVSGSGGLPLSGSGGPVKHFTTRSLFVIGIDAQWTLGGLGVTDAAKVKAAKYVARREQLEFYQTLNHIYQEVRDSYLNSLAAENLIIETTDAVKYGDESLRVAELRFREGVGAYIDVLNAQRAYIRALVDKAKALIKYNVSQAELLHAIGQLSVANVTSKTPAVK